MNSEEEIEGQLTQKLPIKRHSRKKRLSKKKFEQPKLSKSKSKRSLTPKSRNKSERKIRKEEIQSKQKNLLFEGKEGFQIDKMLLSDVDVKRSE